MYQTSIWKAVLQTYYCTVNFLNFFPQKLVIIRNARNFKFGQFFLRFKRAKIRQNNTSFKGGIISWTSPLETGGLGDRGIGTSHLTSILLPVLPPPLLASASLCDFVPYFSRLPALCVPHPALSVFSPPVEFPPFTFITLSP